MGILFIGHPGHAKKHNEKPIVTEDSKFTFRCDECGEELYTDPLYMVDELFYCKEHALKAGPITRITKQEVIKILTDE